MWWIGTILALVSLKVSEKTGFTDKRAHTGGRRHESSSSVQ